MNTINLRTPAQNRRLYMLLKQLGIADRDAIAEIVWEFTNCRTHHTGELSFIECMELIRYLDNLQKSKRTRSCAEKNAADLDRKRKGVIKAIFRWCELQGYNVSIDYVKGIACRAAGVEDFNKITAAALTRIYAEFCKKQQITSVKTEHYLPGCQN